MRKPEENNKFRKKENVKKENVKKENVKKENVKKETTKKEAVKKDFSQKERSNKKTSGKEPFKKQHGSKSERPEKHICPPGECDLAKKCGGCQYQGMDYEKQLNKKHREVKELLGSFGKVEPVIGMQEPFHYRNKVNATFQRLKNGTVISGAYQQGTHSVVKIDECQIEDKIADSIIYDIRGMLRSFKIKVYDEDSGYGLLRHVLVRRGFRTGEVMVVPLPRDPNGDGEYYIDSMPVGYCLIKGANNPEGVALLASCERFKVVDPTVIRIDERQKMEVLGWSEEMLTMWNHMYDVANSHNTIVQYSGLDKVSKYYGDMISFNNWKNPSTWAELKEKNRDALDFSLSELNAEMEAYASEIE